MTKRRADEAGAEATSVTRELAAYLRDTKAWFLVPIVVVVLVLGAIILLRDDSNAAPFVYTLF